MRIVDLTGAKFGRLLVVARSASVGNRNQIKWDCLCDCGKARTVGGDFLKNGKSTSCGCARIGANKTHGMSDSRVYRIYRHMVNRCVNENVESYPLYGGRGITVCDEWMAGFEPFYAWSLEHGYASDLSIDRLDNELGYSPENCKWSTEIDQARNKRNTVASVEMAEAIRRESANGTRNRDIALKFNISRTNVCDIVYFRSWTGPGQERQYAKRFPMLSFDGETKTAEDWSKDSRINVTGSTIRKRKHDGMSDFSALFSPKKTHNGNHTSVYTVKHLTVAVA